MIPQQHHPERAQLPEHQVAFDHVQHQIYKYGVDPGFQAYCVEKGVDPFDVDRPLYWYAFSDYVTDQVQEERNSEGNSLERMTLELAAQLPAALVSYSVLDSPTSYSRADRHQHLERVSYFNGTLRTLAALYPSVKASEVKGVLHNTASMAIAHPSLASKANEFVQTTIHGAQHELAFEKILKHTHRAYREADVDEDLSGIDFLVEGNAAGKLHRIDVKASTYKLRHEKTEDGMQKAYKIMPDGIIVMYSLVRDAEIGDSFTISNEVATERAQGLENMLQEIESAKRVPRIPLRGVRVG